MAVQDYQQSPTIFTLALFASLLLAIVVVVLLVFAWGLFLDKYEHHPSRARSVMLGVLALASAIETGFALCGVTRWWVAGVALVVGTWGHLDAVLRFPAAHNVDSFFSVKQFIMIVFKTLSYAFGMSGFRQHVCKLVFVLLVDVWCLPVLYLMALPLDPAEQVAADEGDDVDLAVRVWQLATNQRQRRRCLDTCKSWWNRRVVAVSEHSQLARYALCAASPSYRRVLYKSGRSV